MKYRVFIASTYLDFKFQRAQIADRLRKADLDVVGMEDWTADPDHPAQLSSKNITGCHFCIALIGFHLGTPSTVDKKGRSITQVEIETAQASGVRVIPFMLRDTTENRKTCPPEFNRLSDNAVKLWRSRFEEELTSGFFDLAETPDVLPAITRQVVKWEQVRRSQLHRVLWGIAVLVISSLLLFSCSKTTRAWLLSHIAAYHDPVAFSHSRNGKYSLARLLNGRSDIQDNTNLREEIGASQKSYSLFANTFGSFRQYQSDYEDAAKRGVSLRFVVTDFSDSNRANWEPFLAAVEDSPNIVEESLAGAANTRAMIRSLRQKYPKLVDYKLNRKPILFTLWIRDPESSDGMAHLGLHYYGSTSQDKWPGFRVSQETGEKQLRALNEQFEYIWNNATKDPEDIDF